MLSPEDIRRRALNRYTDFLLSVVNRSPFFPLQVRFGKPSATEDFDKLRGEINALTQASLGCHIEWTDVNSRRWGRQRLPERVEFLDEATYLRAIGKTKEVARFRENLALTCGLCSSLISFTQERPLDVVEFVDVWPGLLEVCCYLQRHPRPNLYARELPLSVDTKFIERHQTVLTRLLTVALPPQAITAANRFEERFGLRFDEPQIRLRLLDASLRSTLGIPFLDFAIPVEQFRKLGMVNLRVIIAENKMTFLTLPLIPKTVGIWGAGNAAGLLNDVGWLSNCQIIYWGDIDIQGFEILARLRSAFPSVLSVMMDLETLNHFRKLCVHGTPAENGSTPQNLTLSEMAAWSEAKLHNLRLEQERLPSYILEQAIAKAVRSLE